MKVLTDEMASILTVLAKRINPSNEGWAVWADTHTMEGRPALGHKVLCLICKEIFVHDSEDINQYAHAMKHLKDHNLLPFV